MRKLLNLFLYISLSGLLAMIFCISWIYKDFTRDGPLNSNTTFYIEKGSSISFIGKALEDAQIIDNSLLFKLGLRLFSDLKVMKTGEYRILAKSSSASIANIFQSGATQIHSFTIAEGLTSNEIVKLIRGRNNLTGVISQVPKEGSLLPETYYFSYGDSRQSLITRMKRDMKGLISKLWAERATGLPFRSIEEAVILASIVEKETGKVEERAHVAAVFINRIRKGMRLQSDPTIIYGITKGKGNLRRELNRSDLAKKTPFNTYLINGLPPTPIANPGREALKAVLHPRKTNDFYFVANGKGGHAFSETLDAHNQIVRK